MSGTPQFLLVTCQVGAAAAVKCELARRWPGFRLAYSRPGFLTFKLPEGHDLPGDFNLESAFARSHAFSLGKAGGSELEALAAIAWRLASDRLFDRLHVWQRDTAPCGDHDFEPGSTSAAAAAEEALRRHAPPPYAALVKKLGRARGTRAGQLVLDCVVVESDEWWLGWHQAGGPATRWAGGLFPLAQPAQAVSRAWLKMEEALHWSRLPIRPGDHWLEIGCAPGGACQALLARGMHVTGIDPALPAPAVLAHPNFTHLRKRGAEVRRGEFRGIPWLAADVNAAPRFTLDMVESIVTHRGVDVRGLLLTLKLPSWSLAAEVPAYLDRVRSWGYPFVRARQLHHNRQEFCLAALRQRPRGRAKLQSSTLSTTPE